jgi:hypothetical protein
MRRPHGQIKSLLGGAAVTRRDWTRYQPPPKWGGRMVGSTGVRRRGCCCAANGTGGFVGAGQTFTEL